MRLSHQRWVADGKEEQKVSNVKRQTCRLLLADFCLGRDDNPRPVVFVISMLGNLWKSLIHSTLEVYKLVVNMSTSVENKPYKCLLVSLILRPLLPFQTLEVLAL